MSQVILALSPKVQTATYLVMDAQGVSVSAKDKVGFATLDSGEKQISIEEKQVGFVLEHYPNMFELVSPDTLQVYVRDGFSSKILTLESIRKAEAVADEEASASRKEVLLSTLAKENFVAMLEQAVVDGKLEKVDLRWSVETMVDKIIELGL
jgi:hypothetical protein